MIQDASIDFVESHTVDKLLSASVFVEYDSPQVLPKFTLIL